MAANYFVYVLQNPESRCYIGLSDNVVRRVEQHNLGVSKWTRGRGPWRLVWNKGPFTLSEARKLEQDLKRQKGGSGFYQKTGLPRS
jgi:putative endonuclease